MTHSTHGQATWCAKAACWELGLGGSERLLGGSADSPEEASGAGMDGSLATSPTEHEASAETHCIGAAEWLSPPFSQAPSPMRVATRFSPAHNSSCGTATYSLHWTSPWL